MIWGSTQELVRIENWKLQEWHPFFALFPVTFTDGRRAMCCGVERKFVIESRYERSSNLIAHIQNGTTSIKDADYEAGKYVYREVGSVDAIREEINKTPEVVVENGRREAIQNQKLRAGKSDK